MKKVLTLLLITMFSFSGCEKDDICDANTSTTPRLVIQFYDFSNPTVLKNVTDLKVIGEGMTEGIVFNGNGNTVSIPLKTNENSTTYRFILNSGSASFSSEDEIKFDYSRENIYVSRACGFKTIFTFDSSIPIIHTSVPSTKSKWMQNISVEKSNIVNENETHVKIYF
jgi:hypothetical protein